MKSNKHYGIWAASGVVYALLTVLLPPNASSLIKYHISSGQARLISLSFVLPYIAIWFAAFYGYVQCKAYAALIENKKDGKAFKVIGDGLMYLALGLPVGAISGNVLNQIKSHQPSFAVAAAIISNYIGLAVIFAAFFVIRRGTNMLATTLKKPSKSYAQYLLLIAFVVFATAYTYTTFSNPARQFPTASSQQAAYYLPDALLLFTIVIPYLLVWFWGFQAAYEIHLYRKEVQGIVYKDSLGLLAKGIVSVVVAFTFIRFLASLTTLLDTLALRVILAILYVFLFVIGAGYLMIAVGAKRMKKIEEV